MNKDLLLLSMLICYLIPIYYVYNNYNSNNTVSNIICNKEYKYLYLFFMFLMGMVTILYELKRNDVCSIILISLLLIALYGLICFNETYKIHYVLAYIVFFAILIFMMRHCHLTNYNMILLLSLFLQIVMLASIIKNMKLKKNIFHAEVIYIANFAFYYLYLHFCW
jgi:hypothetical protein